MESVEDLVGEVRQRVYDTIGRPAAFGELISALHRLYDVSQWHGHNSGNKQRPESFDLASMLLADFSGSLEHVTELLDRLNHVPLPVDEHRFENSRSIFMLFQLDGRVGHANQSARTHLQAEKGEMMDSLAMLAENRQVTANFIEAVASGQSGEDYRILADYSTLSDDPITLALTRTRDQAGNVVVSLRELRLGWSSVAGERMARAFGLTPTELSLYRAIVEGQDLAEFAARTGRSLATVRTHAKHLLRKTEAGSQRMLVRLYATIALLVPGFCEDLDDGPNHDDSQSRPNRLSLSSGRVGSFVEWGDPVGKPVLYLHGFIDPRLPPLPVRETAAAHGLRVIGMERPGFGTADPIVADLWDHPRLFARDVERLLDALRIETIVLLPHASAMPTAATVASVIPERITSIVGLNCFLPFRNRRQWDEISPWQRVFARSARFAPALLPVLVKCLLQFLVSNLPEKLLDGLYPPHSVDFDPASQPELRGFLIDGFRRGFAQGTTAYEIDARQNALEEFLAVMQANPVPCTYVHGECDLVTPIQHVRDFARDVANVELDEIPGAGHLALYSHTDEVFRRIGARVRSRPARVAPR